MESIGVEKEIWVISGDSAVETKRASQMPQGECVEPEEQIQDSSC